MAALPRLYGAYLRSLSADGRILVERRRHQHQGERVVTGQRIMQAFSGIFLGWTRSPVTRTEY